MWYTDPSSGQVITTDSNGAMDCPPGLDLTVANLEQHPTWKAGSEESGGANPCVGITAWLNDVPGDPAENQWGWAYITQPTSGTGSLGIFDVYHFGRNGTPH